MKDDSYIDTNVQPFFRSNDEILGYLPKQFQTRSIPAVQSPWYEAPDGDFIHEVSTSTQTVQHPQRDGVKHSRVGHPGSDPGRVAQYLFEEQNAAVAILNPLTRGNNPDYRLNNAICAAINDWLIQRWLEEGNPHGRFKGTIRVNPEDPNAAIKEIERVKDHSHMVQIGVPLQSREPYGKPQFIPIWEAAADYGLPVAVRVTGGIGIEFPTTPTGHPRSYSHYATFMPLNYFYHLSSLIAEGVFERIPKLKFVFADGGIDVLAPLIWRMDTIWFASREMTPWLSKAPSRYLKDHARFCFNKVDGPRDAAMMQRWLKMVNHSDLLMFGSGYPYWYCSQPSDLSGAISATDREKIMVKNANLLFGIEVGGGSE